MNITCASAHYAPELVRARYIRASILTENFAWCEVGSDRRYDIRQGTVAAEEVPADIREAALALRGSWPSYVSWPL